ncbi:hypothetical protein [Pseudomonas sp.]|uniref:hypothetical protein n=1 Tax=Pseudomonas sp. TaxID=306 RepID=UPI003D1246E2
MSSKLPRTVQREIQAILAARQEDTARIRAEAARLAEEWAEQQRWDLLCRARDGMGCRGDTVVRLPDGREVTIPCPLADSLCPPRRRALLVSLGFGPRYADPTRERMLPVIGEAVDLFLAKLDENLAAGKGLWLAGPVGVGKTAALAYIAALAWSPKRVVLYRTAPELFDQLAHEGITDALRECPLLMVDDLGTEYDANWPLSRFTQLMDWRWRFRKSVCVTSNLMPAQLARDERWQRVMSRWRATVTAYWQDGEDMRRPEND